MQDTKEFLPSNKTKKTHLHLAVFWKSQTKICSHLREKASKGRFFGIGPDKLQNHTNEQKGKEKKKERGGEEKKQRFTLSFYDGYFGDFGEFLAGKKLLDAKGPFGDNVFKNPARYT